MIRFLRAVSLATIAMPLLPLAAQNPPAAAAQQPAACEIDIMQPSPLSIAYLQRQKVIGATKPEDALKAIRDAMKALSDDRNKSNALGRDYLLAQFYVFAAAYGEVQTRGNLGLPGDKTATVDLIVGIDSLLTIVEKGKPTPACLGEASQWREFKPYQELVQAAYRVMGASQHDSAEKLAKRALILYKNGAQTYDILWRVAKERNDEAGAISNLQLAVEKLAGDTLNLTVRANFLFTLGRIQQEYAEKKTDKAAQALQFRSAAKAYLALITEYPMVKETPFALSGISYVSTQSSDTALACGAVDIVKGATAKYGDVTLAQAGVVATKCGRTADAVAMFEAAAKVNSYSRDYLYNLAAMLHESKRSPEMIPVIKRLVELDPSNGDNWMLYAFAFKALSDAERDPAKKKVLIDSVAYYGKIADEMPHKLVYTEFDRMDDKTVLMGQVENHGKAARSFTIEFEFLGKDGAVVGKQTATVANVAAGGVGDFQVEIPTGGVLGVRYAALKAGGS